MRVRGSRKNQHTNNHVPPPQPHKTHTHMKPASHVHSNTHSRLHSARLTSKTVKESPNTSPQVPTEKHTPADAKKQEIAVRLTQKANDQCVPIIPGKRTALNEFSDANDPTSVTGLIDTVLQTFFGIEPKDQSVNQCVMLPHTGHNVLEIVAKAKPEQYFQELDSSMPELHSVKQPEPVRDHEHDEHHHRNHVRSVGAGSSAHSGNCAVMATKHELNEEQIAFVQKEQKFGSHMSHGHVQGSQCEEACDALLKLDANSDQNCFCWNENDHMWRVKKFVTTSNPDVDSEQDVTVTQFSELPAGKHYLSTTCQADIKSVTLYEDVATNNMATGDHTLYPKKSGVAGSEGESNLLGPHPSKIDILVNHLQDNMQFPSRGELMDDTHGNDMPPPPREHSRSHHKGGMRNNAHPHGARGARGHMHGRIHEHKGDHKSSHKTESHEVEHDHKHHHGHKKHDRHLHSAYAANARHSQSPQRSRVYAVSSGMLHPSTFFGGDHDSVPSSHAKRVEAYEMRRWVDTELMKQAPVTVTLTPDVSDNSMSQLVMKAEVAHTRGCDNQLARLLSNMPWCQEVNMLDFKQNSCTAQANKPCTLVLNNRWDYHLTIENTGTVQKTFTVDISDAFTDGKIIDPIDTDGIGTGGDASGDVGGETEPEPVIDYMPWASDSDEVGATGHHYGHHPSHHDQVLGVLLHVALFVVFVVSFGCIFRWCYKRRRRQQQREQQSYASQQQGSGRNTMPYTTQVSYVLNNDNGSPNNENMNDNDNMNDVVIHAHMHSMKPATSDQNGGSRLLQSSHVHTNVSSVFVDNNGNPLKLSLTDHENENNHDQENDDHENKSTKLKDTLLGPLKNVKNNVQNMLKRPNPVEYNVYESNPDFQYASMPEDRISTDVLAIEPVAMTLNETMSGIESDAQKQQLISGNQGSEDVPDAPNSPL